MRVSVQVRVSLSHTHMGWGGGGKGDEQGHRYCRAHRRKWIRAYVSQKLCPGSADCYPSCCLLSDSYSLLIVDAISSSPAGCAKKWSGSDCCCGPAFVNRGEKPGWSLFFLFPGEWRTGYSETCIVRCTCTHLRGTLVSTLSRTHVHARGLAKKCVDKTKGSFLNVISE